MERGARWATVQGVAKSQTQLKDRTHTHTHTHTMLSEDIGRVDKREREKYSTTEE